MSAKCFETSKYFELKRYSCCFKQEVLICLHSYDLNVCVWSSAIKTINLKRVSVLEKCINNG